MNQTLLNNPDFLCREIPLLLFGGKGGVGKTTMACATAIRRATNWRDERVLLVSTDPAHSVRDALGDLELPENIEVCEIDAAEEHVRFMAEHGASLQAIGERGTFLTPEEINEFLSLSVPGVDELMSFVRLARWIEEDRADHYVIDTAPTGHALRLLGMPEMLSGWLEAVEAFLGKHRYMASVFGGGGDDPVEAFIDGLTESFDTVAEAWTDSALTRFVPVMNAEPMSIAETARLLETLDSLGVAAPEVVVNRWAPEDAAGAVGAMARDQRAAIEAAPESVRRASLWTVPLLGAEPRGPDLACVAGKMEALGDDALISSGAGSASPPRVSGSLEAIDGARGRGGITLFAGKGGVGKTTMACAAAAAMAARGRRVLLVSTDPAGSLGDAFEREIGSEPTTIAPGLEAAQIDAEAEFAALRTEYADELEAFMDELLGGADLTFDREALERLLDLAPPGLDEVMALVSVTERLGEDRCDALVLDTSPSGHLLRLLELPELIEQWLKAIFRVLVNYENVFSLPRVNERLLRLSSGIKSLRATLVDAGRCRLIAVAIPTRLSSDETERLVERCARLGVGVGGLIVNRVTPEGEDDLSIEIARRERGEIANLQRLAGARPVCLVGYGAAPKGVSMLAALGSDLLRPEEATRAAA
jgi:arsenite-transporting ATPase